MNLSEQITERAKEIRTDGYGMSIGEILSLYKDGDIDIHPEFQRIFRWTDDQKSRLIESLLLGIPVPTIFVSQRSDGVWDVIDGVQRLSTILEFMGEYKDEAGVNKDQTTLTEGEYLSELQGYTWQDDESGSGKFFNEVLKRDFKRKKLEFRIIEKESDANAKFDLFQRLNSGSVLSLQEIRNCLLVMLNRDMFQKLTLLAGNDDFGACVQISTRQEEQAYRDELALRFFCQFEYSGPSKDLPKDFGVYLTEWMRRSADGAGESLDERLFTRTFRLLRSALAEETFRRWNGDKHLGPFSISGYEFITTGVAQNIDYWETADPATLAQRIRASWTLDEFTASSGSGVSSRRRMPRLVNASRTFFAE